MTDITDAIRWFIVLTFAGAEWQAYNGLLKRGIDAYYPMTLGDARRGRWQQPVGRPQFPGYLFATGAAGAIRDTIGVRDLLRQGQDVVIIPNRELTVIRSACERLRFKSLPRLAETLDWKVGDIVSVPNGPLQGLPVVITTIDKSGLVRADIGQVSISFHLSDVTSADNESVRGRAAL